eukprot:Em0018g1141a
MAEMAQDLQWDKREQVIGGHLADRYGGDSIQWMAALVWSLATLSMAFVAHVSVTMVLLVRFVTGLAQGVHYPSLLSLLSKRVPAAERNLVFGIISAGSAVGTIVAGGLGSALFGKGWQYMFLITGVVGIIWSLMLRTISVQYKHSVHYQLSERRSWQEKMAFAGVSKVTIATARNTLEKGFSESCCPLHLTAPSHSSISQLHLTAPSHSSISQLHLTAPSHSSISQLHLTAPSHSSISQLHLTAPSHSSISQLHLTAPSHSSISQLSISQLHLTAPSHSSISQLHLTAPSHSSISQLHLTAPSHSSISQLHLTAPSHSSISL